jgi:hypothetical protein
MRFEHESPIRMGWSGAETGTPLRPIARMDTHYLIGDLKKYRQKYRHFSKRHPVGVSKTLEFIVSRQYLQREPPGKKNRHIGRVLNPLCCHTLRPAQGGETGGFRLNEMLPAIASPFVTPRRI